MQTKVDPEVLEWMKEVIAKDEYYDIVEDLDVEDLVEQLNENKLDI